MCFVVKKAKVGVAVDEMAAIRRLLLRRNRKDQRGLASW